MVENQEEVIRGVYVDDCLITSSSEEARLWFTSKLEARFPVNPKYWGYYLRFSWFGFIDASAL
jgi:hypothetical protein